MRRSKSDKFGEVSSLCVLILATILFAGGLVYEGTALKPPLRTAQLALPDPTTGPTLPGLEPIDDEDLTVFDVDEITDMATAVARAQAAEVENEVLRATVESLMALNAEMKSDFQDRERALNDELEMMTASVVQLENELSVSKGKFYSSQ